jgi:ABC-type transport system involved in multi-copper enzyme maturation permease subunit
MRQFITIAINAFMELIRQPVFLLLMSASSCFIIFLSGVPYFGFGDDPRMVKDMALALTFLAGLLGAVLTSSASVAREIRSGTALAVMAKPVSRSQFLLAKYFGLAAALGVLTYINLVACLLASRNAFDAYGDADLKSIFTFYGAVALAYAMGGFTNYFLRRTFVSDAVFSLVTVLTGAFFLICSYNRPLTRRGGVAADRVTPFADGVDWRIIGAVVLILFAIWVIASLALACSTRLDVIPTLAVCSGLFLVGLMSDYLLGRPASQGSWIAKVFYNVVPNWQQFWLADALEKDRPGVPFQYVGLAFVYMACYAGAALSAALWLFEDRELS